MATPPIYPNPEGHNVGYDETLVASARVSPSVMGRWIREAVGTSDAAAPDGAPLADFGAVDECAFAATRDDVAGPAAAVPRVFAEEGGDPESTVAYDFAAEPPPEETKLLEPPVERTKVLDWNAAAPTLAHPTPAPFAAVAPPAAPGIAYARTHAATTRTGFMRNDRALPLWVHAALAAGFVVVGAAVAIAFG